MRERRKKAKNKEEGVEEDKMLLQTNVSGCPFSESVTQDNVGVMKLSNPSVSLRRACAWMSFDFLSGCARMSTLLVYSDALSAPSTRRRRLRSVGVRRTGM